MAYGASDSSSQYLPRGLGTSPRFRRIWKFPAFVKYPHYCTLIDIVRKSSIKARGRMSDYNNVNYAQTSSATPYAGYPPGTTFAQPQASPVQSQPTVVYASSQPAAYAYTPASSSGVFDDNGRQKPVGQWGDGICDWPKNLYPSCYCSACCLYGMYIFAQSKLHYFLHIYLWLF